jgi:hypothetical protein
MLTTQAMAKHPKKKVKKISQDAVVLVIKGKRKKPAPPPPPPPEPEPVPAPLPPPAPIATNIENKKHILGISLAIGANKEQSHGTHTQGGEAWLTSPWGVGASVMTEYNFTNSFSMFIDYSLDRVAFYAPPSDYVLTQNNKYSQYFDLGAKLALGRYFFVKSILGLKKDFSFSITTLPNAVVDQFWHGLWGVALGYNVWQNNSVCFSGETGIDIYFPTSKTGYKTGLGDAVNTLIKINFKSHPAFYTFFKYEFYQLRADIFTNQSGHRFLGGLGITFNMKLAN